MRFAWLEKQSDSNERSERRFVIPFKIVMIVYNVVWWFPIVFVFTNTIIYELGFWSFFAITIIRLCVNLYRNYVLDYERGRYFPLRSS